MQWDKWRGRAPEHVLSAFPSLQVTVTCSVPSGIRDRASVAAWIVVPCRAKPRHVAHEVNDPTSAGVRPAQTPALLSSSVHTRAGNQRARPLGRPPPPPPAASPRHWRSSLPRSSEQCLHNEVPLTAPDWGSIAFPSCQGEERRELEWRLLPPEPGRGRAGRQNTSSESSGANRHFARSAKVVSCCAAHSLSLPTHSPLAAHETGEIGCPWGAPESGEPREAVPEPAGLELVHHHHHHRHPHRPFSPSPVHVLDQGLEWSWLGNWGQAEG